MFQFLLLAAVIANAVQGFSYQQAIDKMLELDAKLPIDVDKNCVNNVNVVGPKLTITDIFPLNFSLILDDKKENFPFYPEGGHHCINSPNFDPTKPLVILVHIELDSSLVVSELAKAFKSKGPHNVLDLDCGRLLVPMTTRAEIVRYVGEGIALIIKDLVDSGYNLNDVTLVGHELGAHVVGFAGKAYKALTKHQLPRIVALNPGSRCFEDVNEEGRLSHKDGTYVKVIHTLSGTDMKKALGTIDFYLIDSLPIAPWMELWHTMVWRFYAEAIQKDKLYVGSKCHSLYRYRSSQCVNHSTATLGFKDDVTKSGTYYLRLGKSAPYGLGSDGIYPSYKHL